MSSARTPVPQPIDDFEGWLAAFAQPSVLLELASLTFCVFLAWGLVRASSNKPSLVVVVESPISEEKMRAMFAEIDGCLSKFPEVGEYDQKI